jgi:hypothetical protein
MARFGNRVVSPMPPNWHGHHPLADTCGTRANNFLIKKLKTKLEKYQNAPHDHLNCTKYPYENTKILPKTTFFLFLFFPKLKTFFY